MKLTLSDSQFLHQGILATPLNHLVDENELRKFSIVTVSEYVHNVLSGRSFVILVDLAVTGQMTYKIGNPSDMKLGAGEKMGGTGGVSRSAPNQQVTVFCFSLFMAVRIV